MPNARPGPPPRAYRDAGTPQGNAAIRFVEYMLGLAAVLFLHCRPTGSNPFHPSRRPLAAILPLFLRRVQLPIPLGLNLLLMPGEHVLRLHVTDRAVQPQKKETGDEED